MKVVCCHVVSENVGDSSANPSAYFPFLTGSKTVDISKVSREDLEDKCVILGGGGLVFEPWVEVVEQIAYWSRRSVAWSVGINFNSQFAPRYDVLWNYGLVGVRDWGSPFEWVPCVSCMHPAFDASFPIDTDVVAYSHHSFSTDVIGIPNMSNVGKTVEEVVRFLSRAETVLTNSYHGAYWATLLGRKVVIVDPFSNKFMYMKHRHIVSTKREWPNVVRKAIQYEGALSECRKANLDFAEKVGQFLDKKGAGYERAVVG